MNVTEEMYRKVEEYFRAIDPEILYKDLVDNYGLPSVESSCVIEVISSNFMDGVSLLVDEPKYGETVRVQKCHQQENSQSVAYALAA